MNSIPCPVEDCSKSVHRGGFCYAHYMKNWRYGTPTPVHVRKLIDLSGQRFGSLTVIKRISGTAWLCQCDCGAQAEARTGNLNRGDAKSCGNRYIHARRTDSGYGAAHWRVYRDRGPIADQDCIDCGDPARHWSYDHDDQNELLAYVRSANPVAYSLNPDHYSPRCVPCHKRFDLDRIDSAALT